jgi:hypothetical protein
MTVYAHILPGSQHEAADTFAQDHQGGERLMFSGISVATRRHPAIITL